MQRDYFTLRSVVTRERLPSIITAAVMLGMAYLVEHIANLYAFEYTLRPTSNHVGDLILDNLPVVDLSVIIIEGALIALVLVVFYLLSQPRYILFTAKAVALFVVVRAFFVSLTHVAIYPVHIAPGVGFFDGLYLYLNFQTGLFFSGHTGMPFLMALIFWHKKRTRLFFLSVSLLGGVAVLFGHVHYSIDVFAAPFMAYGIYHIALRLFPRDYELIAADPGHYFPRP